jgi:VanZ family protein
VLINTNLLRILSGSLLIFIIAAIFIGGEAPGAGQLFPAPWDKVVHFLTFGAITVLAGMAFPTRPLPFILLMAVMLGATDEIHQMFIEGRQPGLDDLFADFVGGLCALPIAYLFRKWIYRM